MLRVWAAKQGSKPSGKLTVADGKHAEQQGQSLQRIEFICDFSHKKIRHGICSSCSVAVTEPHAFGTGNPLARFNNPLEIVMKLRKLAAAAAISLGIAGSAHAVPVALELSLVIDVSGSINTTEYNTQRNGYAAAFNDAGVQNAILSFVPSGGVAVNVIQFAENAVQSIGWTLLDSMGDISAFATAIGNMARVGSIGSGTDIQDGMSLGISSFNNNGYEGNRLVIDVSGDGIQNIDPACNLAAPYTGNCAAVQTARNAAASAGIRVNGLAMEGDFGVAGVTNFYANNVITADGFVITASGIDDFERAVVSKIGREITNVPEPGSIALLGLALSGLAFVRRRRQA